MTVASPMRTLLVGVGARGKIWTRLIQQEPLTELIGYVDLLDENLAWAQETWDAPPDICYRDMTKALADLQP